MRTCGSSASVADWPRLSLREAGVRVIDCEHKTPPAVDAGYPYVTIPEMRAGRVDPSRARRISEKDFVAWTRRALPRDHDVVLSRRTNPGETAVAEPGLRYALGQNLVLLRADGQRVHPSFLRWLVRGPAWWEQIGRFLNVGAVFDSLKVADIPNFSLPIPPLNEQRRIAGILGTLDDKVALNRRMAGTLEATGRTVFRTWFIDADHSASSVDGVSIPLASIATFTNGLALQNFPAGLGDSLPVVKIAQLRAGTTAGADVASADLDPAFVVGDGDVLFSWSGSLEVELWAGGPGALNQHLFKVTSDRYPRWFYYHWLRQHLPAFRQIAAGKATTMGHIQRRHLSDAMVVDPGPAHLRAMTPLMEALLERIVSARVEARTLAAVRDALLPQLLSGDLEVGRAAESFACAVPYPGLGRG